ncbi:DTDP-D-glucose 4,6-dehydratase [Aphelenchoides fujianensis]|nr:DTDP-D-glucose 4,6-dehydratase [Aphelenchoides fujianensis]
MSDAERHVPRNLFVTGDCGFIGSNFINYVFEKWNLGRLVNIDKLAVGASPENIVERVQKSGRYTFVQGNLLDIPLVQRLLIENEIDTVIHFAAITHVDESYENRIGTIQENVIATTSLLESVNVAKSVRRFVHISTDEVYGDSHDDGEPKTETSLFNPTNPYAASKAACELIVTSYHHSYKLPYVMVRMNNVFGPRQAYSKLIPKFTKLAIEGKPYPLMGDGMHTRSWMFVEDCAEAIVRVTERGRVAECYNIGIEFEKANLHLTQMIHEIVGEMLQRPPTKPTFAPIPDRPYHDRRYFIDFSKIRECLGWECSTPFEKGLKRTIEFYVEDYRRKLRAGERKG